MNLENKILRFVTESDEGITSEQFLNHYDSVDIAVLEEAVQSLLDRNELIFTADLRLEATLQP